MKVVGIAGSPRLQGNSTYLLDQALAVLNSHGVETEKIVLNQCQITPCQGHEDCQDLQKCRVQDDVPEILEKFIQADGVIIAGPVYFWSISAQLKILLDRTFFLFTHNIRPASQCFGFIATQGSEGAENAIQEMKNFMGMRGGTDKKYFTLQATGHRAKEKSEYQQKARQMGQQMADYLLAGH